MAHFVRDAVILASGARAATQTLGPFFSPDTLGDVCCVEVILDLTTFTTAASLTLSIEEYVEGAAGFRQVVAAAALVANGTKKLRWGPEYPESANAAATGHVAKQYRVVVTHGNANSHTYSVTLRTIGEV